VLTEFGETVQQQQQQQQVIKNSVLLHLSKINLMFYFVFLKSTFTKSRACAELKNHVSRSVFDDDPNIKVKKILGCQTGAFKKITSHVCLNVFEK